MGLSTGWGHTRARTLHVGVPGWGIHTLVMVCSLDMGGPKGGLGAILVGEVWDHLCVGAIRIWGTEMGAGMGGGHTLWGKNTLAMGDTRGWR